LKKSFASKLTTKQVQVILKSVGFSWENRKISSEGWVDVSDQGVNCWENLSINIYHGGFVDHYFNGDSKGTGDIVDLVARLIFRPAFSSDITVEHKVHAIAKIRNFLGIKKALKPPELGKNYSFANDYFKENSFTRMPNDILRSNLTSNDKLVWLAIFSRCGSDDIFSYPSVRTIADDLCISTSTVQTSITRLIELGLLIQKPRGSHNSRAKFPLVTSADFINEKIKIHAKSN